MKQFFIFLTIIFVILPIIIYGVGIYKVITFEANCINYFELAADANNVILAEKYLTKGIEYLENNNLTSGYTKIFIYKPTNDIGIWYENLKAAQSQLQELTNKEDLTELEESNCLMRLRETLLQEDGIITHPELVSFHPNSTFWFWKMCLIWMLWFAALVAGGIAYEEY